MSQAGITPQEVPLSPSLDIATDTETPALTTTISVLPATRDHLQKELPPTPKSFRHGWRFGLSAGFGCTIFALCCNVVLLVLSCLGNDFVLHSTDCSSIKSANTWSHLGINTLSTLLLGASNYALQILTSPTRQDIDARHARHKSVEIGSLTISNWSFMTLERRFLFVILVASSIPLHLLYNSAVITTTSSILPRVTIVSSDFLEHNPSESHWNDHKYFNETHFLLAYKVDATDDVQTLSASSTLDIWHGIQNGSFIDIDRIRCQDAISSLYMSVYTEIVIHVDKDSSEHFNMTLLDGFMSPSPDFVPPLNLGSMAGDSYSPSWIIPYKLWPEGWGSPGWQSAYFQSCSARQGERQCTIKLIPMILGLVLTCNLLKCAILGYLLFSTTISEPILTLGDAIGSLLERPDQYTRGKGGLSDRDFGSSLALNTTAVRNATENRPWRMSSRRYGSVAPTSRWIFWLQLHLSCLVVILAVILVNLRVHLLAQWRAGLGAIFKGLFFTPKTSSQETFSPVVNALIANAPQLALSFAYLIFNSLFTIMSISAEWSRYVQEKKRGLRVSSPVAQQRSTYWLSLPYKISVPLLVATNISHWLLSESLFVIGIDFYNADGQRVLSEVNGVAWLPLVLIIFLGSQVMMLLWLGVFSLFKFPLGIPIVSTNSWAISANCHSVRVGESLQKLRYGVIQDLGNDRYHVGFSSGTVRPLLAGEYYE